MQSKENHPSSKRSLPALNVDTSMRRQSHKSLQADPPLSQSANRSRSGSVTVAHRAVSSSNQPLRETFLDDITPVVDDREMRRESRDSHDLSLSPRQVTRDSLVDNLLLSLDQFHAGPQNEYLEDARIYSSYADDDDQDDEEHNRRDEDAYNAIRGPQGYGHEYSYSSDLDNMPDDGSRYSSQPSRGRRSNSSSNFPSLLRMASKRSHDFGRTVPNRILQSRSGRGSKGGSSSANSVDLGYTQSSAQRWGHGLGKRSSSFDMGHDRSIGFANNLPSEASLSNFSPYDYDAAPTPTVPVGPRRQQYSAFPDTSSSTPPLPPAPTSVPTLERKRSIVSSRGTQRGRADTLTSSGWSSGTQDASRDLPAIPGMADTSSAPAPTVGYGKHKDLPPQTSTPKERPGFFRRVFGSSRNTTPVGEHQPASGSTTSGEASERPSSKPKTTTGSPAPKQTPPTLTKKPSSFFRRRKKSISEQDAPPPLPMKDGKVELPPLPKDMSNGPPPPPPPIFRQAPDLATPRRGQSPVSSLRQVMNPYLNSPAKTPRKKGHISDEELEKAEIARRQTRGFSPDYQPDQKATIRQVRTVSGDVQQQLAAQRAPEAPRGNDTLSRSQSDQIFTDTGRAATFLHDSSDDESDYEKELPAPPLRMQASKQSLRPASVGPSQTKPQRAVSMESEALTLKAPEPVTVPEDGLKPSSPREAGNLGQHHSLSTSTVYKSASSLPIVQIEGEERQDSDQDSQKSLDMDEEPIITEPTTDDRERAQKIFDGNEDFIQKHKAAAWMGDEGDTRRRTLIAYMELYNFANLSILASLRYMCSRLVLKGETQQVDRILEQFSKRWCESNPNHGFKIADVVHTLCYSMLLLNTDLHMADIEQRMTKNQFVKNTISTVRRVVQDHVPESFDRHSILPPPRSQSRQDVEPPSTASDDVPGKETRSSLEVEKPSWRMSMKPPARVDSDGDMAQTGENKTDDCGPLVRAPFRGTLRAWETQVELVLKETYVSIRNEKLPLFGADPNPTMQPSQSTLSVFTNGILRRTPSVLSKTPSEAQSYGRGRQAESLRFATGKWANKNRSRPRLYPHSTMGSSRTSLDDQSVWSPNNSSSWSKYSLGKTHTSMSVDSFGSHWKNDGQQYAPFQQSIGFASALSQAIIREDVGPTVNTNNSDELRTVPLLEDESLELAGAPWAKEGIVKHKHHLEAVDKKAKDRAWIETFAVIEKGYMSLFSFSTKSMRNKAKGRAGQSVVGGGNWQSNAELLGQFLLRQTIASALPSPGYSKSRPHVWALSLPTGAVHLFQVGTPEIVREFVSTANYWSARLSNHPFIGGISNIEYGWSDAVINSSLVSAIYEPSRPSTSGQRPSLQGSIRSSFDQGIGTVRPRLPGDKVVISDWTPPQQSMQSSNLLESDQLHTLTSYVKGIEDELQKHNQLRSPMLLAFTTRHPNGIKAMANWEKKSAYLLREIVKFRTYIDSLQAAEEQKQLIYREREAQRAVAEHENEEAESEDIHKAGESD